MYEDYVHVFNGDAGIWKPALWSNGLLGYKRLAQINVYSEIQIQTADYNNLGSVNERQTSK